MPVTVVLSSSSLIMLPLQGQPHLCWGCHRAWKISRMKNASLPRMQRSQISRGRITAAAGAKNLQGNDQATNAAQSASAGVKGAQTNAQATKAAQTTKAAQAASAAVKGAQSNAQATKAAHPASTKPTQPAAAEAATAAAKNQAATTKATKTSQAAAKPAAKPKPTNMKGAKQAVAQKGAADPKTSSASQLAGGAGKGTTAMHIPWPQSLRQVVQLSSQTARQGLQAVQATTQAALNTTPAASFINRAPPVVARSAPAGVLVFVMAFFGLTLNAARKAFTLGRAAGAQTPAVLRRSGRGTVADTLGGGPRKASVAGAAATRTAPSGTAAWSTGTWAGYLGELLRRIRHASDGASYLTNIAVSLPGAAVVGISPAEGRDVALGASPVAQGAAAAAVMPVRGASGMAVTGALPQRRQGAVESGGGMSDGAAGGVAVAAGPRQGWVGSPAQLEVLCLTVEGELETLRQKLVSLEEVITALRQQQNGVGGGKGGITGGRSEDKQVETEDVKAMEEKIASLTTRSQQLELLLDGSRAEAVRARVQLASSEIRERNAWAEVEAAREEVERLKQQSGIGQG